MLKNKKRKVVSTKILRLIQTWKTVMVFDANIDASESWPVLDLAHHSLEQSCLWFCKNIKSVFISWRSGCFTRIRRQTTTWCTPLSESCSPLIDRTDWLLWNLKRKSDVPGISFLITAFQRSSLALAVVTKTENEQPKRSPFNLKFRE